MTADDLQTAKQKMLRVHLRGREIHDRRVLDAMGRVPREEFIGEELRSQAYADQALAIDCSQTISQPFIVALMSQALDLSGSERVLEIGTGSGYQTAVLAELAEEVISIERHEQLSADAGVALEELGYSNITLVVYDGTKGWPSRAPYDRVIVTAAAARCPAPLFDQLKEGGILVIPLGGSSSQVLQSIRKVGGRPKTKGLSGCRFVPLIGAQG